MKPLDRIIYRSIEWRLHHRESMRAELQSIESDIINGGFQVDYTKPKISPTNKRHEDTLDKVIRLEAKTRALRSWLRIIDDVQRYFDGTQEGKLFQLFYGKSVSNDLAAAAIGVNRRDLARLRDHVVYRCAIAAAAEKLLTIKEERGSHD